jgi:hypothetical protein
MTNVELARACASRRGRGRNPCCERAAGSCGGRQLLFRARATAARQATDLSVAQAVVAEGEDLARDGDLGELAAAALIVADGAPGLIKAIERSWPASDRQRCCVHRARNLYAKLPESERERVKHAYWQALDDAINERDAKQRLQALASIHRSLARRGVGPVEAVVLEPVEAVVGVGAVIGGQSVHGRSSLLAGFLSSCVR